jgi:hypothetical protein
MDADCITYEIDENDRIVSLCDAWAAFAMDNDGEHLADPGGFIGRSLFDFISDGHCRELYRMIIARSRADRVALTFPFRCDSPAVRRYMSMRVSPADGGLVELSSRIVSLETRAPAALLDHKADRAGEFLTICSWCKKVWVAELGWSEVETAVEELGLFNAVRTPRLSHGMCPVCFETVVKQLNAQG